MVESTVLSLSPHVHCLWPTMKAGDHLQPSSGMDPGDPCLWAVFSPDCECRQWLTAKGGTRQKRRPHETSLSIFSFKKTLTPILGASLALSHLCSLRSLVLGKQISTLEAVLWRGPCGSASTEALIPTVHEELEPAKATWVQGDPSPSSFQMRPQPWLAVWLQPHERPWTRGLQINSAQIPDTQKLWGN